MGKDGDVYGSYDWPAYTLQTIYWTYSGFPSTATYGVNYKFAPGSYYFAYRINTGYSYYPYSDGTYEYVGYTVTANEGSLLSDGDDKYFEIYCGYSYDTISGLSIKGMGDPIVKADGSRVYSNENYTITLSSHRLEELPEGAVITTFTK